MKKILGFYIIIGIGAFTISYFLQTTVFMSITDNIIFALGICAVFELAKIMTIVFHCALKTNNYFVPPTLQNINAVFKSGLILLSLICSIAIISKSLDRPNLKSIKQKETALAEKIYSEKTTILNNDHDKQLELVTSQIKEKYKARFNNLKHYYEPRIKKEEKLRDYEFDNIIGGVRKGQRWHEHDRKVKELTKNYNSEKKKLQIAEDNELKNYLREIESGYEEKIIKATKNREQELKTISTKNYINDDRVNNQLISSFLLTLKNGLGINLTYLNFTLLFSLLISALLEGAIYIIFNYAVIYSENVLNQKNRINFHFEKMQNTSSQKTDEDNYQSQSTFEDLFGGRGFNFQNQKNRFSQNQDRHDPCGE